MSNNFIKEYLSFTKKERVGVMILVAVTILVYILPYVLPKTREKLDEADLSQFRAGSAKLINTVKDSNDLPRISAKTGGSFYGTDPYASLTSSPNEKNGRYKVKLFDFDPNTLPPADWHKLGIRDKTITTIRNYLLKGGSFRQADDLGKIYGLRRDELERLKPFVRINKTIREATAPAKSQQKIKPYHVATTQFVLLSPLIDINTADTTMLITLPGIGSKLAARIVLFREKLGAFHSIYQLSEIYGLADSTFQKIRSRLTISPQNYQLLNINTAEAGDLKRLPYFSWNAVNAILAFRNQHGSFKDIDDLLQLDVVTPGMLKKVSPYITVE